MAALHHADCRAHPGCDPLLHLSVCPVSDNDLALDAHAAHDVAILTVSVRGLVFIHKVHVDRIVRKLLIKLCM